MPTDLIKGDFECANGPWKGQHLFLTRRQNNERYAATGVFDYKGEKGRYIEDPIDGKLYWEKQDDDGKQHF